MEGAKMLDLAEAVHIDAPLTDVWRVVTDVRRHPELAGPKSITKAIDFDGPDVNSWLVPSMFGGERYTAEVSRIGGDDVASWKRLVITVRSAR